MYCDINLKLLPSKNTQKVNKQKIRCKNLGFAIREFDELNKIKKVLMIKLNKTLKFQLHCEVTILQVR